MIIHDNLQCQNINQLINYPIIVKLLSNFSITGTYLTNVPNITTTLNIGTYIIEWFGYHQSSSTANGMKMNVTFSGTGLPIGSYTAEQSTTSSTNAREQPFVFNTSFNTTAVSPSNTNHFNTFRFFIVVTTAGVIQLQFASNSAGSTSTLIAGSSLIITKINN